MRLLFRGIFASTEISLDEDENLPPCRTGKVEESRSGKLPPVPKKNPRPPGTMSKSNPKKIQEKFDIAQIMLISGSLLRELFKFTSQATISLGC